MRDMKYRLECYKKFYDQDYDEYHFASLEKAEDFIRIYNIKRKYQKVLILHEEFAWQTKRVFSIEELEEFVGGAK